MCGETRFNDNLEQNISREKRPDTHSSFAINYFDDIVYNLFITVNSLGLKLLNLVPLAEKFNQMNI